MSRQVRGELLTQRETFERYERPSSVNQNHGQQLACEYRAPVPGPRTTSHPHGIMACEYRRAQPEPHLACEYRQGYPEQQIACEYRADPRFNDVPTAKTPTTIRTYLPTTEKKKIPLGLIVGIAIAVPILIIVILFGAVWLQELGIL